MVLHATYTRRTHRTTDNLKKVLKQLNLDMFYEKNSITNDIKLS